MRLCLSPGCANMADYRGRCYLHSKENDRTIDRAGRAVYSRKQWKHAREAKLRATSICERCRAEYEAGMIGEAEQRLATEVHHRVPIADGGPEYAQENLEVLCKPHHSRETRREQLIRTGGEGRR